MWAYIFLQILLQLASWLAEPQVGDPFYPGEWADTDDAYEDSDNVYMDWLLFVLASIVVRLAIIGIHHIYNANTSTSTKLPAGKALKRRIAKVTTIIIKDPAACRAAMVSRPASPLATPITPERNDVLTEPFWHQLADLPAASSAASAASSPAPATPGPIAGSSPPPPDQRNAEFTPPTGNAVLAEFYRQYPRTGTKRA